MDLQVRLGYGLGYICGYFDSSNNWRIALPNKFLLWRLHDPAEERSCNPCEWICICSMRKAWKISIAEQDCCKWRIEIRTEISDLQNESEVKQLWQQSGLILDIYNIPDWNTDQNRTAASIFCMKNRAKVSGWNAFVNINNPIYNPSFL